MSFFSEINETLRGFAAHLRDAGKERFKNPLLRAYVLFWLARNWQLPFIIFFGDSTIDHRLKLIKEYSVPPLESFGTPLLLAVAYVFAMPWVSWFVYDKQKVPIQKQKLARMDFELMLMGKRIEIARADVRKSVTHQRCEVGLDWNC